LDEKKYEIENLQRTAKLENQRMAEEIEYLKNEIKKIESQKLHELNLINAENTNAKNNLSRANKKAEEELKNRFDQK
jgi:hypothetical protein